VMLPAIRRKVQRVVEAETGRGTFLVETIIGIRTVKSLALDARHRHEFDVHTAKVAEARYSQGLTENLVQTVVHPLQSLMTNGVVAIAVYLAIAQKEPMYIGAVIAFMMLTGRVAGPLIEASKWLVKIDGNDLRAVDVDHLRSSIGVVLQENFLFRGTIRDTIAATKPDASFEEVVRAARLAGAEEFIERLPAGYQTFIQEGSTNLS